MTTHRAGVETLKWWSRRPTRIDRRTTTAVIRWMPAGVRRTKRPRYEPPMGSRCPLRFRRGLPRCKRNYQAIPLVGQTKGQPTYGAEMGATEAADERRERRASQLRERARAHVVRQSRFRAVRQARPISCAVPPGAPLSAAPLLARPSGSRAVRVRVPVTDSAEYRIGTRLPHVAFPSCPDRCSQQTAVLLPSKSAAMTLRPVMAPKAVPGTDCRLSDADGHRSPPTRGASPPAA